MAREASLDVVAFSRQLSIPVMVVATPIVDGGVTVEVITTKVVIVLEEGTMVVSMEGLAEEVTPDMQTPSWGRTKPVPWRR